MRGRRCAKSGQLRSVGSGRGEIRRQGRGGAVRRLLLVLLLLACGVIGRRRVLLRLLLVYPVKSKLLKVVGIAEEAVAPSGAERVLSGARIERVGAVLSMLGERGEGRLKVEVQVGESCT